MLDKDNNPVVVIESKNISRRKVANNNTYKEVRAYIEKELKKLSGDKVTIIENGKDIYFDDIFADEYANSNNTVGANNTVRSNKVNAVQDIKTIIEHAKYKNHKKTRNGILKKKNSNADVTNGFDYYDIKFAFPSEKGYAICSGILNVRIDSKRKNFAYDIIINKSVDYGSLHEVGHQPLSTDNDTITKNQEEINTKNKNSTDGHIRKSARVDSEGRVLKGYNDELKGYIEENKNNVIIKTEEELSAYIDEAFTNKLSKRTLYLGIIPQEIMTDIKNNIQNISNKDREKLLKKGEYSLTIHQDDIRHLC